MTGRKDYATGICRVISEEVAKEPVPINYLLINIIWEEKGSGEGRDLS